MAAVGFLHMGRNWFSAYVFVYMLIGCIGLGG